MRRLTRKISLSIIFVTIFSGIVMIPSTKAQEVIDLPPASFTLSPYRSYIDNFEIRDYTTGQLIDTISSGDFYHDPQNRFPDIDTYVSGPFFVSPDGSGYLSPEDYKPYLVDPATIVDYEFSDGSHKFVKTLDIACEVLTRTYQSDGAGIYDTQYISPLVNITHQGIPKAFALFEEVNGEKVYLEDPTGVILASRDTGVAPHEVTWEMGSNEDTKAKITSSLEDWRDTTTMDYNLHHLYGNSKLTVTPKITLDSYEDFLLYDYYVSEGNQLFNVKTNTTQMAIIDVNIVSGLNQVGKVKNYAMDMTDLQLNMDQDQGEDTYSRNNDPRISEVDKQYSDISKRDAYLKFLYAEPDIAPITGEVRSPLNVIHDAIYPSGLSIGTFSTLQTSVEASFNTVIQPFTTVHWANYHCHAVGYAFSGNWWDYYNKHFEYDIYPRFPYLVNTENVYSVTRLVFKIVILSDNIVSYIPVTGEPIQVDDITDYVITSTGFLNPNFDTLEGSTLQISRPWYYGVQKWWDGNRGSIITIIILVIGAIVALTVMIAVIKRPRNR